MTLRINGDSREVNGARTVAELVAALGLPPAATLVEHNGLALRRDEWAERILGEGDRVECLQIAAGG